MIPSNDNLMISILLIFRHLIRRTIFPITKKWWEILSLTRCTRASWRNETSLLFTMTHSKINLSPLALQVHLRVSLFIKKLLVIFYYLQGAKCLESYPLWFLHSAIQKCLLFPLFTIFLFAHWKSTYHGIIIFVLFILFRSFCD